FDEVSYVVIRDCLNILLGKCRKFRPRAYERQVTSQNIPKLGQLVESSLPQKLSDPCHSVWAARLLPRVFTLVVASHASELNNSYEFVVCANSFLSDENRPAVVELDGKNNKGIESERNGKKNKRNDNVHKSFQYIICAG